VVGRAVIEHLFTSFLPRVPIHCSPCGIVGGHCDTVTVSIRMVPFSLLSIVSASLNIHSPVVFGHWFYYCRSSSHHKSNENIPVLYISWKSWVASLVYVWVFGWVFYLVVSSVDVSNEITPVKFLPFLFPLVPTHVLLLRASSVFREKCRIIISLQQEHNQFVWSVSH